PEWYLMIAILTGLVALSVAWRPLKLLLPLLAGAALPPLAQACLSASRASFRDAPPRGAARLGRRMVTVALHLLQPLARLAGRLLRLRSWPHVPASGPVLTLGFVALAIGALHDRAWPAAAILGLVALLAALRTFEQCTAAMATIARGLGRLRDGGA